MKKIFTLGVALLSSATCFAQSESALKDLLAAANVDSLSEINVPRTSEPITRTLEPQNFEAAVAALNRGERVLLPASKEVLAASRPYKFGKIELKAVVTIQGRSVTFQFPGRVGIARWIASSEALGFKTLVYYDVGARSITADLVAKKVSFDAEEDFSRSLIVPNKIEEYYDVGMIDVGRKTVRLTLDGGKPLKDQLAVLGAKSDSAQVKAVLDAASLSIPRHVALVNDMLQRIGLTNAACSFSFPVK